MVQDHLADNHLCDSGGDDHLGPSEGVYFIVEAFEPVVDVVVEALKVEALFPA